MGIFQSLFGTRDSEQLYRQAVDLMDREKFSKAARLLERAIKLNSKSALYHFALSYCYSFMAQKKGESEDGNRYLDMCGEHSLKAIELSKQHRGLDRDQKGKACFNIGLYYQYKNDLENSIKYLKQSISLCPDFVGARLALIRSYNQKGDNKKVLELIRGCLLREPKDDNVWQFWMDVCQEHGIESYCTLPEERKMKIYNSLKKEIDSVFLRKATIDPLGGLFGASLAIESAGEESYTRAIATISSRYKIDKLEVVLILREGDENEWSFDSILE